MNLKRIVVLAAIVIVLVLVLTWSGMNLVPESLALTEPVRGWVLVMIFQALTIQRLLKLRKAAPSAEVREAAPWALYFVAATVVVALHSLGKSLLLQR